MTTPRVVNRRYSEKVVIHDFVLGFIRTGPGPIYVGRPGPWGNPFHVGKHGTRAEAIALYREWLLAQPALVARARRELRGRDLECWCAPLPCHADVLLEIANGEDGT